MKLKLFDYLSLSMALAAIIAISLLVYSGSDKPGSVVIKGEQGEWIYPLDRNDRIRVEGPLGITEIFIEGRTVRVVDSPCPEKTCVTTGSISASGAWIACLPNRVFVRIAGSDQRGIDATAF